jgi:hypothetical protein
MLRTLARSVAARRVGWVLAAAVGAGWGGPAVRAADGSAAGEAATDGPLSLHHLPAGGESPLYLQIVNPADKARGSAAAATRPAAVDGDPGVASPTAAAAPPVGVQLAGPPRLRSFELPPVTVYGEAPATLKEEERIGSYEQPRWTAARRFPGTRIYVVPEGTAEFEFWLRPTVPKDGATKTRSLFELELGLPYRFQLDLYFRIESVSDGPSAVGESVELRYALADWNKIWGNPTLYAEWTRVEDEPDSVEFKLLLGGEIAPRWPWGVNFSDELSTGGERANEIEFTGGVSYTLADSRFSVGAETEVGFVDTKDHRGNYDEKFFFVGPSFQYRPTEQFHIDVAPLAGIGLAGDSPRFRAYLVIGYEF